MTRTQTVERMIRSVQDLEDDCLSDKELLEQFVQQQDQEAFEILVRRHTAMVLGVCRRGTLTTQDAEDATQATFVLLAQKASTTRWKNSIANWLYTTARRVSRDSRLFAKRREKREKRSLASESIQPIDQLTARELLDALDEELDNLPTIYRECLVLCYLEGLTRDQVASRLGVPGNTVKTRLERGRKKLGEALQNRGIALGSGLLTLATISPTRASLSPFVETVLASVSGTPSPTVLRLIEGVTVNSIFKKTIVLVLMFAGIGLFGIGSLSIDSQAADQKKEMPAKKESSPEAKPKILSDSKKIIDCKGIVLDPEGKPLAKAKLYWPKLLRDDPHTEEDIDYEVKAISDAQGRFEFSAPTLSEMFDQNLLIVVGEGFGIDWADFTTPTKPKEFRFQLVKDTPVEGHVITSEGKPVVGAKVAITGIFTGKNNKPDMVLKAWKAEPHNGPHSAERRLDAPIGKIVSTSTDREGKFQLRGVGVDRIAKLTLRGKTISETQCYVVHQANFDPLPINRAAQRQNIRPTSENVVYGPKLEIVVLPPRTISGIVRDRDTQKPLSKVRVSCSGSEQPAITDSQGRYQLTGLKKETEYLVHAYADEKSSYLPGGLRVKDEIGLGTIQADLVMAKGIVVSGQVTDSSTKKGVRGFLTYAPLPGNTHWEIPGFDSFKVSRMGSSSKPDGTFRVVVPPSIGVLMFQAESTPDANSERINPYLHGKFTEEEAKRVTVNNRDGQLDFNAADNTIQSLSLTNAIKVLDLKPDQESIRVEMTVDPGKTLTLEIQDSDGKPLSGALVSGLHRMGLQAIEVKSTSAKLYALDSSSSRTVAIVHPEKKLGGVFTIRGDENDPVKVKLGRVGSIQGRLLNEDGKPLAGVYVTHYYSDRTAEELNRQLRGRSDGVITDSEGRFRIDNVLPQLKFFMNLQQRDRSLAVVPRIGEKTVKPNEVLDLGDRRVKPPE